VLVLAQVHVDARAEIAAQNVVHGLDADLVRIVPRRRDLAGQNDGLQGAGPVEK
jgi:hypothetical protein